MITEEVHLPALRAKQQLKGFDSLKLAVNQLDLDRPTTREVILV
ncbi:hypothetical protein HK44_021530 [Pseudomonas fluorescens HK44]|uniref:Uncharacterized protein n=1 Tax=Pseudomonas fluorescens HK44 TaxID=1042209 RepID=A0A010RVS2_PSEFL|nr:hypothetical protein HK44_021530 [Pseudomonas fluorescens HK44]